MNGNAHTVLEGEATVARDVVGVRVRLQHAFESHPGPLCSVEVLLDRERRVDDNCHSRLIVTDEVRRAAEPIVHELLKEQHDL